MRITLTMNESALPETESCSGAAAAALRPMNEAEFRAFYERTSRPLWLYLTRITGDSQAADDLLQEAYYRFYRAGASHESETHRRNSLFRIATNLVHDSRRRSRHRPETFSAGASDDEQIVDAASAGRAEHRTDLDRAMARLRPEQREMIWLAYVFGSSHAEIAEIVGVKTASVKPLLFRARRKLAELLRGRRD